MSLTNILSYAVFLVTFFVVFHVGGEVIMKTPSRHTRGQSPQTFIHQVVTSLPDTIDRIWTLRYHSNCDEMN